MILSRIAIRSLLKKQNNEELILQVLSKLRPSCPNEKIENFNEIEGSAITNEKIENFNEINEIEDIPSASLKRSQQQIGLESPCSHGKRAKFNTEQEENLTNIETQSPKLTQYDSTPNTEYKGNNDFIDLLTNEFNFMKEGEVEEENKNLFCEKKENGNSNAPFNVDDFFS